jgi:hypothetical protein
MASMDNPGHSTAPSPSELHVHEILTGNVQRHRTMGLLCGLPQPLDPRFGSTAHMQGWNAGELVCS